MKKYLLNMNYIKLTLLTLIIKSLFFYGNLNAQCTDAHAGTGNDVIANVNAGQSFQPTCSGTLNTISMVGNAATTGHTVTIYSGLGTGGTQLGQLTNQIIVDEDVSISNFSTVFDFSSQNITLSSGMNYTFVISGPLRFFFDSGNGYANGEIYFDGGFNSGSDLHFEVDIATALPVELSSFYADVFEKEILLNWETTTETNNERFEIELSSEGQEFKKIGEVEGSGTNFEKQNYSFIVRNPLNGISYYRLKQIDFDGQFEYSEIVSVNFSEENRKIAKLYPNPSRSGMVNLDYYSPSNKEIKVFVFDVVGNLVTDITKQVSNGTNILSLDFSDLNKGMYIIRIDNEITSTHENLIISR